MANHDLPMHDLQAAIRAGLLTSASLVQSGLSAQERWRHLNSVVTQDIEELLARAQEADDLTRQGRTRGALHGIPLVIKDNINTATLPTSACTPALRENRPGADAPVVQRLCDAGALVFGKTNMHELAFGITNNHGAFGAARNPYNPVLIPGGSSGGTAAAVAAGIVRGGLGSDTGGSTRIPASFCGICGFRPTMGRYPTAGVVPISRTRDTPGPMARCMADLQLLDEVLCGRRDAVVDLDGPEVRLGIPRAYYYEDLDPEVARITAMALERLRQAGFTLIEADIPDLPNLNNEVGFPVAAFEAKRDLAAYLADHAPGLSIEELASRIVSPDVRMIYDVILGSRGIPEIGYRDALTRHRPALQGAIADYFRQHELDAMVIPTVPVTARPLGDDETIELNGRRVSTMGTIIRNTDPSSNAGIPSLTVPAGMSASGLPVGISFEGPAGSDAVLLALGARFELITGPLPGPRP